METKIELYEPKELVNIRLEGSLVKMNTLTPENRLGVAKQIVVDLLALLGVSGERSDVMHHARAITFITVSLNEYAPEEIIFAFHKAIKGDFPNVEIFQQLNSVVLGRVMREYNKWLRGEYDKRKASPIDRIEKESIGYEEEKFDLIEKTDRLKKDIHQNGRFTESTELIEEVYLYLRKKGELPKHTKDFRERIIKLATPLAKAKIMQMVQMSQLPKSQLKPEIERIDKGDSEYLRFMSQAVILKEYFKV